MWRKQTKTNVSNEDPISLGELTSRLYPVTNVIVKIENSLFLLIFFWRANIMRSLTLGAFFSSLPAFGQCSLELSITGQ